ncbi:TPA: hypothetical protein ACN38J_003568 [Vibrio parahaemolyticus]
MEKPIVRDVLVIARQYVSTNKTNLHMVINNKNIKDEHINFCLEQARKCGDEQGVILAETLLKMSKTQRLKLVSSI